MINIDSILTISATIIGMVSYRKLTIPFRILTISLLVSTLINLLSDYIFIPLYKNNAPLSHTETISHFVFYALIYYHFFKIRRLKQFVQLSLILVSTFFIVNALYLQPLSHVFPTNLIVITDILRFLFSVLLFRQMLLYPVEINIIKQSAFWYNTAILFYAATGFLNASLMNYYGKHLLGVQVKVYLFEYLWNGTNIIFDILFIIAILTDRKTQETTNA